MRKIFTLFVAGLLSLSALAETQILSNPNKKKVNILENADLGATGWKLQCTGNTTKNFESSGNSKFAISGGNYIAIKLSNKNQNTVTLPEGKVATQVTFYATLNKDEVDCKDPSFWSEVDGVQYEQSTENNIASYKNYTAPSVATFPIDNKNVFTFTNAGYQSFVVLVVEFKDEEKGAISYGEGTTTFTWGDAIEGLPVLSNENNLTVKYASSDVNVATVDEVTGAVTVVGAGTTEISATAAAEGDAKPVVAKYTLVINKKKLAAPAITFDAATGLVTIGAVEGAEKVEYTVNGKDYNEYSEPFTVADGVTVAARAIVPNANFEATEASQRVLLAGVEIEKPVISQFNGTFYVSCATPATTIMIKRGDAEPVAFTRAITVEADETITAFATREGCENSAEATVEVKALPAVKSEKTIYLGHGSFKAVTGEDGFSHLDSKSTAEKDGYGFSLILNGDASKSWAAAGNKDAEKIQIPTAGGRTGIKGSNGKQFTLQVPEGLLVNRVTIYSYVNADNNQSGWKEVNGVNYDKEVKEVPMGARSADVANPDVRVFNFDGAHGSITFNNAGAQLVFVMAVDIVESMDAPVHGHGVDGTETEIELPSNTEIKLSHADNDANIMWRWVGETANDPAGDAPEVEALAEETAPADGEWKNYNDEKPVFNHDKDMTLEFYAEKNGVKSETKNLRVKLAETVGIADINVDNANAPVEYFNLQGIRVDNPSNGIFIRRQGNEVSKVIIK